MRFAGYAAIFDRADRGGDVIRRGAFARSLARAGSVPLLWQHRRERTIGRIERIEEDKRGLRVIGRVSDAEVAAMLGEGRVAGLSFGYRVRAGVDRAEGRELTELALVEVSVVRVPMQPLARVHAVAQGSSGRTNRPRAERAHG